MTPMSQGEFGDESKPTAIVQRNCVFEKKRERLPRSRDDICRDAKSSVKLCRRENRDGRVVR